MQNCNEKALNESRHTKTEVLDSLWIYQSKLSKNALIGLPMFLA